MPHASLIGTCIAVIALACGPAGGQGTYSQFSDPMTSAELATGVNRHLGLDRDQWTIVHTLHGDYLEAARKWRDEDVERYLVEWRGAIDIGIRDELLPKLQPRRKRVAAALTALDTKFFEDVIAALDEPRRDEVDSMRLMREWRCLQDAVQESAMSPQGEVNLAPSVIDGTWSDEERAALAPLVRSYQTRANAILRRMSERAFDVFLQGVLGAHTARGDDGIDAIRRGQRELGDLNRGLLRDVSAIISALQARLLRVRLLDQGYRMLGGHSRSIDQSFRLALRVSGLSDAQRTELEESYRAMAAEDDALIERGMRIIDEGQLAAIPGAGGFYGNDDTEKIAARRDELVNQARERVKAVLGEDRLKRLERRHWGANLALSTPLSIDGDDPPPPQQLNDWRPSSFLIQVRPIDVARLDAIAARGDATDAQRELIKAARDEYAKRWEQAVKPAMSAVLEYERKDRSEPLAGEREARAALGAAVRAADEQLFASVAAILEDDAQRRGVVLERVDRAIQLCARVSVHDGGMVADYDQPWSPTAAIADVAMDATNRGSAETALAQHADALLAAAFAALEADAQSLPDNPSSIDGGRHDSRQASRSARAPLLAALEKARDAMVAAVDEPLRPRLETAALVRCSAMIFTAYRAPLALDGAQALDDLSNDQRARLAAIRSVFDQRYLEACRRARPEVTVLDRVRDHASSLRLGDAQSRGQRGNFDCAELEAHVATQLRTILGAEQLQRVPMIARLDAFTRTARR